MDEKDIIHSAKQGDTEAMRAIFERNRQKIFSMAYRYTGNVEDAEDILQETFIKTFRHLERYKTDNHGGFSSWVTRIGIHCSIDYLRRKKTRKHVHSDWESIESTFADQGSSNPEDSIQLKQLRDKITGLIAGLSPRQRMVFILKHHQQLKIREIAESLGCSEGSVKKQLFRAMESLKKSAKNFLMEKDHGLPNI